MSDVSARRRKIIAAVGTGLFLAVIITLSILFSRPILDFVKDPDKLRLWVDEKGFLARLAFVGIVLFQVVAAFIPGEPVEIAAGLAFGAWEGALLCLIGAAVGSCLVFLVVRKWGVGVLELFFPPEKHKKLTFLQTEKRVDAFLFLILFIPGTPKDLISYFAGLTRVRFSHFLWITLVARIPSVITSTWGGDALVAGNWPLAIGIFIGTGAVSFVGLWLFERISARRAAKKAPEEASPTQTEERTPERVASGTGGKDA